MSAASLRKLRLAHLTISHFAVDLYGGFFAPLIPEFAKHVTIHADPDPHLRAASLATLAGICGVVTNLIQPVTGVLSARVRGPVFLFGGLVCATAIAFAGVTQDWIVLVPLLLLGHLGIGAFHPDGMLAAHGVSGRREAVGVPIFLSSGMFGYSLGALLATAWVGRWGFAGFWLLALPGLLLVPAGFAAGLHRVDRHAPSPADAPGGDPHAPSFWPLLALGSLLTSGVTLLFTFYNIHMTARYGDTGFRAGGQALFAAGLASSVGAFLWSRIGQGRNPFRVAAFAQALSIPCYILLLKEGTPTLAPWLALPAGFTIGSAIFPIAATSARRARGLTPGLRVGLIVGGSWGFSALLASLGGILMKHGVTVETILLAGVVPSAAAGILALVMARGTPPRPPIASENKKPGA